MEVFLLDIKIIQINLEISLYYIVFSLLIFSYL